MSILELITSIEMGLIYGIVAIGIYFTFRIIDFPDLTCDGSFVLGSAVSGILIKTGYNPYFALLISLAAGSIAGLCTGILNVKFRISNLLSGILVAFMLYSVNLKVMQNVPNIALINNGTIFTDSVPLVVLFIIAIVIWILCSFLLSTDIGLGFRSIGQNRRLAINMGVNVSLVTTAVLMISNALIGFAGGLFAQIQGFADISGGLGTVIVGFAAVIIGEKIFPFGKMWCQVLACLLGSIVYRSLVALALNSEWLGIETQDLNLITGVMVIAIMITPNLRRKSC